ncbi:SIMPL domain-containing protein [Oceanobacillus senegalensis]|uniref:SIMPL domain-containing protein n=1 Tax=Oceanobacillus senegalensis TaxID=1936063 RepID=UPI0015C49EFB|nr:SIMPL domain-containing protein [Oceanobacillus senegalensis]
MYYPYFWPSLGQNHQSHYPGLSGIHSNQPSIPVYTMPMLQPSPHLNSQVNLKQGHYPITPFSRQQYPNHPGELTVTGTANLSVSPDYASVLLAVITENESLQEAQQENANRMNQVLLALQSLGIPKENIQTSTLNILPRYDYVEGSQIFRGYEVINEILVIIQNINEIGNVIDTAVDAGINRVTSIQFNIEQGSRYYQQVLKLALENAREKANTIADTMEITLKSDPIVITEQLVQDESPVTNKVLAATPESFTTPIVSGQIQIRAKIKVIYNY